MLLVAALFVGQRLSVQRQQSQSLRSMIFIIRVALRQSFVICRLIVSRKLSCAAWTIVHALKQPDTRARSDDHVHSSRNSSAFLDILRN
jgi:hypothetical protein